MRKTTKVFETLRPLEPNIVQSQRRLARVRIEQLAQTDVEYRKNVKHMLETTEFAAFADEILIGK